MASVVFSNSKAVPGASLANNQVEIDDRLGWGFALLLLTTATLFLRPADLLPQLENWPIYQGLILACLLVSGRAFFRQLSNTELARHPVSVCLLALLLAVGLSHLSHGFAWGARTSMYKVGKLIILYGLIVGLVNTPARLHSFVRWITIAIVAVASLALLDRFEYISVAALESVQDRGLTEGNGPVMIDRIRGTGIFHDPNDFGLVLVTGIVLCGSLLTKPGAGWLRCVWILPGCILLGTLALTHSRGALLALISAAPAVMLYFRSGRFGSWAVFAIPIVAITFSGRMTDINAINEGTGQGRLQIWAESIAVWQQHPVFGIGEGLIVDEIGMVTHNSFLHCYAELGTVGGTAFLSCFLAAGLGLWKQRTFGKLPQETGSLWQEQLKHQRGFVFVAMLASVASMLSISRQFAAPTYLILGVASAAYALDIDEGAGDPSRLRFGNRFYALTFLSSAAALASFIVMVRLFVRW